MISTAMKVVVTGGAGFIGANLCRMLEGEDFVEQVVVLDDLSTGSRQNLTRSPLDRRQGRLDPGCRRPR